MILSYLANASHDFMSITGYRAYSIVREQNQGTNSSALFVIRVDVTLLWPLESQRERSVHHRRSTYLCQFPHLRTISSCPITSLTTDAIIVWLWHIVDARCCSFHRSRHDFVIDSQRCPIRRLLGWLSHRVSSPTVIPLYTLIQFDKSADALPFLIKF